MDERSKRDSEPYGHDDRVTTEDRKTVLLVLLDAALLLTIVASLLVAYAIARNDGPPEVSLRPVTVDMVDPYPAKTIR